MPNRPRSMLSLVDYQVREWEARRRVNANVDHTPHWPSITVSREFGAQGAAVGLLVAKRFGFEYWDQELVHEMADRSGVDEALLESLDEHTRASISALIDGVLRGGICTESQYLRQLLNILHTIEQHGNSVVIGRGAQYVMDPSRTLRVRVVSPRQERIKGIAARKGLSLHDAENVISTVEKDRHTFIDHHYHEDVSNPSGYDVLINTGTMNLEQTANMVAESYRCKFGETPEE